MVTVPGRTDPVRAMDTPVTFTPEQRESVRLQFAKKLDWSILTVKDSAIGVGTGDQTTDSSFDYILATMNDMQMAYYSNKVYGVDLSLQEPNRLKSSQLPEDWSALNVSTDLHAAKTVGELVAQIAKQTGAELYCDPRYADRTIRVLGDTARAADLLHALTWSLTATWRRVDSAFLLTDDLVGLGVRHVKIDDWVQENALLAQLRNSRVSQTLAEKQYRSMGWSPTDPVKPDDALIGKIDAYVANPPPPNPSNNRPQPLLIPVSELPAAGQAVFHQENDHMEKEAAHFANDPHMANSVFTQPIKQDVVQMGVRVQVAYIVPGVGKMAQSTISGNTTNPDILYKPVAPTAPTPPVTGPLALGQAPAARALLVQAKTAADLDTIAREAQQKGFNQLWVAVAPGDTHLLEAAVRAGKANGLAVQAVVHLMRSTAKDTQAALDRNILGETVTQYIHRRHAMLQTLLANDNSTSPTVAVYDRIPLAEWESPELGASFELWGDFRQSGEAEQRAAVDAAVRLASVPGLAGVVLEDTAAPGFAESGTAWRGGGYNDRSYDPMLQLGYTPEMRLACLRQNGFDPIDLSPLQQGDRLFSTFQDNLFGGNRSIALPFFRDYGISAGLTTYGTGRGDTLGAKDAWLRWCALRSERRRALLKAVTGALASQAAHLPVRIRQNDNPLSRYRNAYQLYGASVEAAASPANPATPVNAQAAQKQALEAQQKISYLSVESMAWSASTALTPDLKRQGLAIGLKEAANWDGLVLDLGDMTPTDALAELRTFSPPTDTPVAPANAPTTPNSAGH